MKISLAVLLVFGLAAVITALPATQDEFEVEQPNLEEQDIPEGAEPLENNDDEFTEGNDEVDEQDDEDINMDLQDLPMDDDEDPELYEEDPAKKPPRPRPPQVCQRPFKLKVGCYQKKCYRCCSHCRVGYVHCSKANRACRFHRLCGKVNKKRVCVFVRRCHRIQSKCRYVGSCFNRNCRRVVKKKKPAKPTKRPTPRKPTPPKPTPRKPTPPKITPPKPTPPKP